MTQVGTPLYCAPEILKDDFYDEQVDVYSFGVMMNEMDTRELPFTDPDTRSSFFNALKVAEEHLRPVLHAKSTSKRKIEDSTNAVQEVIQQCWSAIPSTDHLHELLASLENLESVISSAKQNEVRT